MLGVPETLLQRLLPILAFVAAVAVVWALDRPGGRWGRALRRRFVLGVPWGTFTVAVGVLLVYLVLQGGLDHWFTPMVVPFRAWSYLYPLGMVTASFAHTGPGHLVGNLVGTLTLAPLAEYAYGHFPRERGSHSFGRLRDNPFVRAFVVVPGAVVAAGLVSSVFALGPVIGFSGVVFAFAGFALVYYPFTTVLAVSAGSVVRLTYNAWQTPTLVATSKPVFSSPWWASIAIQGHALGLFIGVVAGVWLARRRGDERPAALRLWTGVLLYSVSQSLWAVYWFRGADTFVLFRAAGTALVVVLATLVAVAVTGSERQLRPGAGSDSMFSMERWQVGLVLLLLGMAAVSGPAVPYNVVTAGDEDLPGQTLSIRDYEVTYAEGIPNGQTAALEVEAFGETTTVNASGVIVRSEERAIWTTAVSQGRLAFAGRQPVRVGGVGWRETVVAVRDGWTTTGGNRTYRVVLRHDGENTTAFTAPPARADPVIAGRNVTLLTTTDEFLVAVTRNNETVGAPIPPRNESVVVDGVRFVHQERDLVAVYNETRVTVASEEVYRARQFEE